MHYGPLSYHRLGRTFPRDRLREPFPQGGRRERLLRAAVAVFVSGQDVDPAESRRLPHRSTVARLPRRLTSARLPRRSTALALPDR